MPFGAFSDRLTCTVTVVDGALGGGRDGADLAPVGKRFTLAAAEAEAGSREQQAREREEEDEGGLGFAWQVRLDSGGGPRRPASG